MPPQPPDPASLTNLHDIVLPPPVPWWPPAPGWYILAVLILIVAVALTWLGWRRWRANRYRRAALRELGHLRQETRGTGRAAALRRLPEMVKRTALATFPCEDVGPLSGGAWLRFLDRSGQTDAFTTGQGRLLEALAYEPVAAEELKVEEVNALFRIVRHWILRH